MKTKKYRIVTDRYLGYEIQFKYIFFPFWFQLSVQGMGVNTFDTVEGAEAYVNKIKQKVVKNNL